MTTHVVNLRFGEELCSMLREVEECHDGIFQQPAMQNRYIPADRPSAPGNVTGYLLVPVGVSAES